MTLSTLFIGICICLGSIGLGAVAYERWHSWASSSGRPAVRAVPSRTA
jgi:hypothetical protein